ncbi:MAG: DUF6788 family protein [Bryobacteraceae bacterium]
MPSDPGTITKLSGNPRAAECGGAVFPVPSEDAAASCALDLLARRRDELKTILAGIGDMRPGSLVERYRKCGKPTCRCARQGAAGHGPCFSLTQSVGGKTRTRILAKGPAVERTRAQIAEYQRFRAAVRELVELSGQIADAEF